jgi:hypothetical protein
MVIGQRARGISIGSVNAVLKLRRGGRNPEIFTDIDRDATSIF